VLNAIGGRIESDPILVGGREPLPRLSDAPRRLGLRARVGCAVINDSGSDPRSKNDGRALAGAAESRGDSNHSHQNISPTGPKDTK